MRAAKNQGAPKAAGARFSRAQQKLLDEIELASRHCVELERQFGKHPAPRLETLIKVYHALVLNLSVREKSTPAQLRQLRDLMKPVLDWAQLQEKRKQRQLAEQKYHDQVEAGKSAASNSDDTAPALKPETLEKIELELKLL